MCLYSVAQGIMDNGHMGPPPSPRSCEQIDITENVTMPQLRYQAVITGTQHKLGS